MGILGQQTGSGRRSGLKEKLAWLFRERELILRSEGKVHYTRVRSAPQMMAAGAAVAVAAWLIGANALAWWQEQRIVSKDAQIVEARVAYERLRSELSLYQQQIADMANDILAGAKDGSSDNHVDLEELAAITAGIEGAFDQISRDLDVTEADRRRIIQSRDALHGTISQLEGQLSKAETRIASLQEDVRYRDDRLDAERETVDALTDSRDHWRDLAEDHQANLHDARGKIVSLEGELSDTVTALGAERVRVADLDDVRERLTDTVRSLEDGLSQSEVRGEQLVANVARLTETIDTLKANRLMLEDERSELQSDLAMIEAELSLQETSAKQARERMDMLILAAAELTGSDIELTPSERVTLGLLETEVASLMSDLRTARLQRSTMETAISEVVLGLAQVTGASENKVAALESTDQKVEATLSLFDAVSDVQSTQHDLVLSLIDRAEADIAQNESILAMAGLDIEYLLARTGYVSGVGGPLETVQMASVNPHQDVLPVPEAGGTAELADDIGLLENRLNKAAALNELMRCVPLMSPVDNFQLTSKFGPRKDPFTGRQAMHKGIDIGGWAGIKVHAAAPGVVIRAGSNSGYGYMVEVDHGCGITTVYAHLRRIKVKKGDVLDHRAIVGTLGNTGRSTGPHLHYEVRVEDKAIDPLKLIQAGRFVHKI